MQKLLNVAKAFGRGLLTAFRSAPRKLIYVVVTIGLVWLKRAYPDLAATMPEASLMTDLVMALLLCHTATDIAAVAGTFAVEHAKAKLGKADENEPPAA